MTAEDRAAHVEREAVALVLAAHVLTLHSFLSVIGECECGEWKKSSLREQDVEAAHRLHQADAVLAALPQTGDAAAVQHVVAHEHGMELVCSCGTLLSNYGLTRTLHSLWAAHLHEARAALAAGADQ